MTCNETLHVELTPLQSMLLKKVRRHLPADFTEEEVQQFLVSHGFLSIDADVFDDMPGDFPEELNDDSGIAASECREARHVEDTITVALDERLRLRLERLLLVRPGLSAATVFADLLDLGISTLVELRVVRDRDLAEPKEDA